MLVCRFVGALTRQSLHRNQTKPIQRALTETEGIALLLKIPIPIPSLPSDFLVVWCWRSIEVRGILSYLMHSTMLLSLCCSSHLQTQRLSFGIHERYICNGLANSKFSETCVFGTETECPPVTVNVLNGDGHDGTWTWWYPYYTNAIRRYTVHTYFVGTEYTDHKDRGKGHKE